MNKTEALKLALEQWNTPMYKRGAAITAIKEALAQPENITQAVTHIPQEHSSKPVGRFARFSDGLWREVTEYSDGVMLYTAPPKPTNEEMHSSYQRGYLDGMAKRPHPLTDKQMRSIYEVSELAGSYFKNPTDRVVAFARAIEAAHDIKETT